MNTPVYKHQSGQATTELAIMLLGFVILLLGLIFSLSLEIFNTRVLLDSKHQTEKTARFVNGSTGGGGQEIRGWEYTDGIPFSLSDQAHYGSAGEIFEADTKLEYAPDSRPETNYNYEWTKLEGFSQGGFKHDYHNKESNAMTAANLITRPGDAEGRQLTARLPELISSCAKVLGIRINYENLRNNPSNRVYMPANGEL